ncbi:MAG: nucleoside kinase [Lachnospiraceae bacterium]|nr:nucleoside kinase [Lachnospiraceae bacterium]
MINITVKGQTESYQEGTTYLELAKKYQKDYPATIALAVVGGRIQELMRKPDRDCEIDFLTFSDSAGHKAYVRTATMMFLRAAQTCLPQIRPDRIKVEFAIGDGYYISLKEHTVAEEEIALLSAEMKKLYEKKITIHKTSMQRKDAIDLFSGIGMSDKVNLFRFRRSSTVNVYELDGYKDYYYGYMLPDTGYVDQFELLPYKKGVILNLPNVTAPHKLTVFEGREKLFNTLNQANDWGSTLGIDTVGDLNNQICQGNISDLVLVQEALQERRIGEIAKDIAERGGVKFVMIAGPSSSGKTSFSHRLSIQLRTLGLNPHPIALDNYFKDREHTPRDEHGNYNFECLEAIDTEKFNEDMTRLLKGERVELPTFNFKTGAREYLGDFKQLGPEDILVLEGIHGLNDKMSYSLPSESKYKIYISALTSLNIDEHNRIPTTDVRLLRRMVRDARTRGASAQRTIGMWYSVRKGEEEYIFPFQENADAFFNSALIYELAVIKQYAEPLLFSITPDMPEYLEAKRLLKFLEYFLGVSTENLPNNSLVREFVGGSVFPV